MDIGFIAYIALEATWVLSGQDLRAHYEEMFAKSKMEITQVTTKNDNAWILRVGATDVAVVAAKERLQSVAYEYALQKANRPETSDAMEKHKSFIMIASLGKPADHDRAVEAATAVTLVTAALAARPPSSAVLFSSSDLLLPPFAFVDVATICE